MALKNLGEDKVFIALITIFLIGAVGTSFEQLTGGFTLQTNDDIPIVTVFPQEVKAGEKVNVNVKVRGACVDPTVEFYFGGVTYDGERTTSGGRKAEVTQKGRFKFCKDDYELDSVNSFSLSYQTRPEWDGDYFVRVYYWKDKNTKDYLHSYFTVKPTSK